METSEPKPAPNGALNGTRGKASLDVGPPRARSTKPSTEGINITGVDELASSPIPASQLFEVHLTLSQAPAPEWVRIFNELWTAASTCPVRIQGSALIVTSAPEDLERHHHYALQQIVLRTNESHSRELAAAEKASAEHAVYVRENNHRIRGLGSRLGY